MDIDGMMARAANLDVDLLRADMRLLGSYERLPALLEWHFPMELAGRLPEWFAILGREWDGFDNVSHYLDDLIAILPDQGPVIEMMDDDELRAYEQLPETVSIFRGAGKSNKWGLSWSLSEEIAKAFPSMLRYWQDHPMLYMAQVKKSQILAIKLGRGEMEVITLQAEIIKSRRIGRYTLPAA